MSVNYFSDSFLSRLRGAVDANLAKYSQPEEWITAFAGGSEYSKTTGLSVVELPTLMIPEEAGEKHDGENAQKLYLALKELNSTQACDERLWAYLSHITYREYMQDRWSSPKLDVILERYFIKGRGLGGLSGNGIARLWWGAYLTIDEKRANPFELTQLLFKNQDIQQGVMERSLGKNRHVVISLLDFVRTNEDRVARLGGLGGGFKRLIKRLNFEGAVRLLDSMPSEAITPILEDELGLGI